MSKIVPPPTPLEELLDICASATEATAWAVGQGENNRARPVWYVYCSSRRFIKKLPSTYRGRKIKSFHCPKPRIVI